MSKRNATTPLRTRVKAWFARRNGNTGQAWTGRHIWPFELFGKLWSSRHPDVFGYIHDDHGGVFEYVQQAEEGGAK